MQATPLNSLSQTPLYQHIISSIPSLRIQIQNAVTASMKQWLLEIRNVTGTVGKAAIEVMDARTRKWRTRREKDPMLRLSRVGSAVEVVTHERSDSMSDWYLVYQQRFTMLQTTSSTRFRLISNLCTSAFIFICHWTPSTSSEIRTKLIARLVNNYIMSQYY